MLDIGLLDPRLTALGKSVRSFFFFFFKKVEAADELRIRMSSIMGGKNLRFFDAPQFS